MNMPFVFVSVLSLSLFLSLSLSISLSLSGSLMCSHLLRNFEGNSKIWFLEILFLLSCGMSGWMREVQGWEHLTQRT